MIRERIYERGVGLATLLLAAAIAGCGSGNTADTTQPTVSSTIPVAAATGVAMNGSLAVTFNKAIDPSTITGATFTLKLGTTPVPGTVSYTGVTATFSPTQALTASSSYTATITSAKDLAGNALASSYSWSFSTGAIADTTAPVASSTVPADGAVSVATNAALTATFSEAMDPATISTATFTVTGPGAVAVTGTVTYVGQTATFHPATVLATETLFTATITTGTKDLAGNALAASYTWSFTTAVAPDTTPPTVASTIPASDAVSVATNAAFTATFSEAMDPATISTATFTVTGPSAAAVTGTVTYVGQTATFHPASVLAAGTLFTATITTGVTDLAGNALAASYTSSFTTGNAHVGLSPVLLGSAVNYVILAKTGISTVPDSVVTGDVGLSPAAATYLTGFSLIADSTNVFSTSPQVTGNIYASNYAVPTPTNLTTAVLDMQAAYSDAAGRPTPDFLELGTGAIGGLTLAPGLYKWAGTVTIPTDVVISGNATDVWIFQIAGDLTMSPATNVSLSGGALAKNVFWQVAGTVDIGTTAHFEGILLSQTGIALKTGASMNGRALAQSAVTLDKATVTQPAP